MAAARYVKQDINGILLLDKPLGLTSNAALQQVKHLYQARKAGHTGSLDPLATGMLPICFGEATKFSQFLLDSDKCYQVTAKLGVTTTTGDADGAILTQVAKVALTTLEIMAILPQFQGTLTQIPPMYSALKYQGQPLYVLARQGKEVLRAARYITIYSLKFIAHEATSLTLEVHCSKGTYIRTLIEDIGKALGCGAHVTALRRLHVSTYHAHQMLALADIKHLAAQDSNQLKLLLLPPDTAVANLPALYLPEAAMTSALQCGQKIKLTPPYRVGLVRLINHIQHFLGIGEIFADGTVVSRRLIAY